MTEASVPRSSLSQAHVYQGVSGNAWLALGLCSKPVCKLLSLVLGMRSDSVQLSCVLFQRSSTAKELKLAPGLSLHQEQANH